MKSALLESSDKISDSALDAGINRIEATRSRRYSISGRSIAELPAETLRSALALACHGEGTHGNFLGLFGETLLLSAVLPLEGLDADTLAARILGFSDAALDVRDALTSPAASAPSDSTPDAPVPSPLASLPPIPGPFIGFIA